MNIRIERMKEIVRNKLAGVDRDIVSGAEDHAVELLTNHNFTLNQAICSAVYVGLRRHQARRKFARPVLRLVGVA